jgi:hypothetical protein
MVVRLLHKQDCMGSTPILGTDVIYQHESAECLLSCKHFA